MSRGAWVLEVICSSDGVAFAVVVVGCCSPSPMPLPPCCSCVGFEQITSIQAPELSSKIRIVRRSCSSREIITPAKQMNWIGWLL